MRNLRAAVVVLSALYMLSLALPAGADDKPAPSPGKSMAQQIPVTSKSPEAVKAFEKGRELSEDIRLTEATEQFKKAIDLDPKFALAHAYLGSVTPGAEGHKEVELAASLAKDLPEAERLRIEVIRAQDRGKEDEVRTLWQKLTMMAPGDWRVHFGLGAALVGERKWDAGLASLKKAAELNPKAGSVHNTMGYAYLNQSKPEQAVEAFRKYAALNPDEPNPQDSLAEALMAAGKLTEAEEAFRKATEISPKFWISWEGVAMTKFLRGDWVGGREALGKAKDGATRPIDKLEPDGMLAWSHAAEGNAAAAIKAFDALESAATAAKVDVIQAFVPLNRARLQNEMGKPEGALQQIAMALDRGAKLGLPGGEMNDLRREALGIRITAEEKLGRPADAKTTLGLLEKEGKNAPQNAALKSTLHFARGEEAMARGDAKGAVGHYSKCNDQDSYCRRELVMAQEKAGDRTGAEASRQKLLSANLREPLYLYVRAKLGPRGAEGSGR